MTNDRGNPTHPPVVTQAAYQSELDKLRASSPPSPSKPHVDRKN